MPNKISPPITTRITTFLLKVLETVVCIFCGFRVTCHEEDKPLQTNEPDHLLQKKTTIKERNTQPATTQIHQKPVGKPAAAATVKRPIAPLIDNQAQWSQTLWNIHDARQKGEKKAPLPVDELKNQHRKIRCWSWEWFPAELNSESSAARKRCAFKNENDLMTYYHSKILMGGFIKLAEEAVKYPMCSSVDEMMLSKSLLLCLYAAQKAGHDDTAQHLNHLIQKQKHKISTHTYNYYKTLDYARERVGSWLKANCTPVAYWPFS